MEVADKLERKMGHNNPVSGRDSALPQLETKTSRSSTALNAPNGRYAERDLAIRKHKQSVYTNTLHFLYLVGLHSSERSRQIRFVVAFFHGGRSNSPKRKMFASSRIMVFFDQEVDGESCLKIPTDRFAVYIPCGDWQMARANDDTVGDTDIESTFSLTAPISSGQL